jgi:hypothetical protein
MEEFGPWREGGIKLRLVITPVWPKRAARSPLALTGLTSTAENMADVSPISYIDSMEEDTARSCSISEDG